MLISGKMIQVHKMQHVRSGDCKFNILDFVIVHSDLSFYPKFNDIFWKS